MFVWTANQQERKAVLIMAGVLVVWLGVMGGQAFHHDNPQSPDEAANRLMSQTWAKQGNFQYHTDLTADELSMYHPRSLAIQGSTLRPGSFLGFIWLQGWMLKLGPGGPMILSLLISFLGFIAWYHIARRFWEWPWALASVFLVASLPVLIAHQLLPFMQAGLYTGFLLLAGWALLKFQDKPAFWPAVLVGVAYGLALFIRPVEVLFTGPIIAVVMLARRKPHWFLVTTLVTILVQIPWLVLGQQTFGAPVSSGYSLEGVSVTASHSGTISILSIFLRPAGGVWSWYWLTASKDYLVLLYPAMSLMAALALLLYFRRKFVDPVKIIKIGLVGLFVLYYLAYYGSWHLYPDAAASKVGSLASYARYWIPLYVAMAGGTIVFLRQTLQRFSAAIPWLGILVLVNLWTWWAHPAGFRKILATDTAMKQVRSQVVEASEAQSLVIAGQNDKLLLGSRLTSFSYPQSESAWSVLKTIIIERPVYFLGLDMPIAPRTLERQAQEHNLLLVQVATISGQPLWRVEEARK